MIFRYRSPVERLLRVHVVPQHKPQPQDIDMTFLNRELVWSSLTVCTLFVIMTVVMKIVFIKRITNKTTDALGIGNWYPTFAPITSMASPMANETTHTGRCRTRLIPSSPPYMCVLRTTLTHNHWHRPLHQWQRHPWNARCTTWWVIAYIKMVRNDAIPITMHTCGMLLLCCDGVAV